MAASSSADASLSVSARGRTKLGAIEGPDTSLHHRLRQRGLGEWAIAGDGNCLFEAFAFALGKESGKFYRQAVVQALEQLTQASSIYVKVRQTIQTCNIQFRGEPITTVSQYARHIERLGIYGSDVDLLILSNLFDVRIWLHKREADLLTEPVEFSEGHGRADIHLVHCGSLAGADAHFNATRPRLPLTSRGGIASALPQLSSSSPPVAALPCSTVASGLWRLLAPKEPATEKAMKARRLPKGRVRSSDIKRSGLDRMLNYVACREWPWRLRRMGDPLRDSDVPDSDLKEAADTLERLICTAADQAWRAKREECLGRIGEAVDAKRVNVDKNYLAFSNASESCASMGVKVRGCNSGILPFVSKALAAFEPQHDAHALDRAVTSVYDALSHRLRLFPNVYWEQSNEHVARILIDSLLFEAAGLVYTPELRIQPEWADSSVVQLGSTTVRGPLDYAILQELPPRPIDVARREWTQVGQQPEDVDGYCMPPFPVGCIEAKHLNLTTPGHRSFMAAEAQLLLQMLALLDDLESNRLTTRQLLVPFQPLFKASRPSRHVWGLLSTGACWYLYLLDDARQFTRVGTWTITAGSDVSVQTTRTELRALLLLLMWLLSPPRFGVGSMHSFCAELSREREQVKDALRGRKKMASFAKWLADLTVAHGRKMQGYVPRPGWCDEVGPDSDGDHASDSEMSDSRHSSEEKRREDALSTPSSGHQSPHTSESQSQGAYPDIFDSESDDDGEEEEEEASEDDDPENDDRNTDKDRLKPGDVDSMFDE